MNFPLYKLLSNSELERHYCFVSEVECHMVTFEQVLPNEVQHSIAVITNRARLDWLLEHPLMQDSNAEAFEQAVKACEALLARLQV